MDSATGLSASIRALGSRPVSNSLMPGTPSGVGSLALMASSGCSVVAVPVVPGCRSVSLGPVSVRPLMRSRPVGSVSVG